MFVFPKPYNRGVQPMARELKFCGPRKGPNFQALQFLKGIARAGLKVLYSGPKAEQIFHQI